ncbi:MULTISPECIES: hypothetical protein [Sphingobacterium]|uniref:hypothetical protein n=1 Tax=Sphingobacterium TaxID=28453 RepID=UPI00257E5C54|nr:MULTISPECIES: hypothetical protein [Sphingobacterium]
MKTEILEKIRQLGGNIDNVKGNSLAEDILSITFNTVLYQKPEDTPWQTAEQAEPIYGIGAFINENEELFNRDKQALYDKIIEKYFCLTKEGYGQIFWQPRLFTPFKEGTDDFEEWNIDFTDEEEADLSEIIKVTNDKTPDFIELFYSYGFPDNYYICLTDPNPQNPTLFGTDHEVFFREVTNEGNLEDFINTFMTKDELLEIVKKRIEK